MPESYQPDRADHAPGEDADELRPAEFLIDAGVTPGTVVVRAFGDIDVTAAPTLADALRAAIVVGSRRLVIDAIGITFIDAAGLRPIVEVANECAMPVAIRIARPSYPVARVLQLTNLLSLVDRDSPIGRLDLASTDRIDTNRWQRN